MGAEDVTDLGERTNRKSLLIEVWIFLPFQIALIILEQHHTLLFLPFPNQLVLKSINTPVLYVVVHVLKTARTLLYA